MTRRDELCGICVQRGHEQRRNTGNSDHDFDVFLGIAVHLVRFNTRRNVLPNSIKLSVCTL